MSELYRNEYTMRTEVDDQFRAVRITEGKTEFFGKGEVLAVIVKATAEEVLPAVPPGFMRIAVDMPMAVDNRSATWKTVDREAGYDFPAE
jgi:hypothetical protein